MTSILTIHLLRSFRLFYNGVPVTSINTPRLQSFLAYLLLHHEAPQLRQHLSFLFWPDSSEAQARTNLRKLFYQLRQALPDADRFLCYDAQTIQWDPAGPFILDVAELQRALERAAGHPLEQERLIQVVTLYQGDLLPGCYDEWLFPVRQQLQQSVQQVLEQLVGMLETRRAYKEAIQYAQRLLALDPLREATYRDLIRLHALNGDDTSARRVYRDCVEMLRQELDVKPGPATQAVYKQLLNKEWVVTLPAEQVSFHAPLVGRLGEWQTLQAAWRTASRGQTHFVCIAGEAGIGKTRLAEELLLWARRQGIRTASAHSYAAGGRLAYAPITELLRADVLWQRLPELGEAWLVEVARLLPELFEIRPQLPHPKPLTESWQRQRFLEALARAVLVTDQPLLLLLDDLQWSDQETVDWLHFLLHFDEQAPLLVVGTVRSEEMEEGHPLLTLLLELRRNAQVTEIELEPLGADEVARLAAELAGRERDAARNAQLYQDTEGNPLFVVETVRAELEEGSVSRTASPLFLPADITATLPPKVHAVIHGRLARLSPPAQELATLAAVIGRSFTFDVLAQVWNQDEDTLVDSLDELWQRRIVREQEQNAYDFSHDKIRDVAYRQVGRARRQLWHRRVAEALETIHAGDLDAVAGDLATHYEQAGHLENALYYFERAGDAAYRMHALASALGYYTHALDLIHHSGSPRYEQRYRLLLAREEIHWVKSATDAQHQDLVALDELVDNAREVGVRVGRWQAEVPLRWTRYLLRLGRYLETTETVQQLINDAQAAGAVDIEARARIQWAWALWCLSDLGAARWQLEQTIELALATGLTNVEAQALELLAATSMFSGSQADEIQDYLTRCLYLSQANDDLARQGEAYNKLGYLLVAQGEGNYQEAREHYKSGLRISQQISDHHLETLILSNLGALATYGGDYACATEYLEQALVLGRQGSNGLREAVALSYLGYNSFNQGDYTAAEDELEEAVHILERLRSEHFLNNALSDLGLLYLYLDQHELASTCTKQALQLAIERGDRRQQAKTLTRQGHLLVELERFAEASEAYQEALQLHREMKQYNRSMEPLAGMAHVALLQGAMVPARAYVEDILAHLHVHPLDRTEEALRVYLRCYQVLQTSMDNRARKLLQTAYSQLKERADTILDAEMRQRFWTLPDHHAILEAIRTDQPSSENPSNLIRS